MQEMHLGQEVQELTTDCMHEDIGEEEAVGRVKVDLDFRTLHLRQWRGYQGQRH
jgi:hypothetical protein